MNPALPRRARAAIKKKECVSVRACVCGCLSKCECVQPEIVLIAAKMTSNK